MAKESFVLEGLVIEEAPDYKGDPQEIIRERLTPKALQRMEEMLESSDEKVVDRAVERIGKWDKRLQAEEKTGGNNVAILNFPPEYLERVLGGVKEILGGTRVQAEILPQPKEETVDNEGLE